MRKRDRDHPLLDLTPDDLQCDSAAKLARMEARGVGRDEIDRELRYLEIMSSRKVKLPDDAFFAQMRQQIYARVEIKPVSFWERLTALWPDSLRPDSALAFPDRSPLMPALVSVAAVLLVAVVLTFSYHNHIGKVEMTAVAYGPYASIGETYTEQVSKLEVGQLSREEIQRCREILTMSIGILGSPSSLSRSRALIGSGGRL
jgi:hypothetical protein